MSELTIRRIKNTEFVNLYSKLITNAELSYCEREKLLEIAIIFINSQDLYVKRLGYRIIVVYSNRFNDYSPLYDISINQELYPISRFIENNLLPEEQKNFFTELNAAYTTIFDKDEKCQSGEQYILNDFYIKNLKKSISVVAPTSYGKTDLILDTLKHVAGSNVCILTPTKSLLAQTRKRILAEKIDGITKIVVHPEMYNPQNDNCVAVLTQERLLSLLKNHPTLSFDYVIVDEAHDILEKDDRNELLASSIMILNKRNADTVFKFLTPFLNDSSNLKVKYTTYDLDTYKINEYIKTEKIYVYDIIDQKGLKFYDQFFDTFFDLDEENTLSDIDFLIKYAGEKNIVYFNKPSDIEKFAKKLIDVLPDIELSNQLERAIENISEYLNPEYTLVKCLKKGFIYHHGSVPDAIRQYIEYQYAMCDELKFVLTSSTLLEGVNLPADKMFLLDNRKGQGNLSPSSFKNLIGRVCRFSEIFNSKKGNLKRLEPEIYLLVGSYFRSNSNYRSFLSSSMKIDKEICDISENVLLENTIINATNEEKFYQAQEFVENYENGIIQNFNKRRAITEVGKSCILNNVIEFDVFASEVEIQRRIDWIRTNQITISSCKELVDIITELFINKIDAQKYNNYLRFNNQAAKNYYAMILNQKIANDSYSQMISKTIAYWKSLIENFKDTIVYVGRWGDLTRNGGFREFWTDISKKSHSEKINLAIVRIKEEQDFIDNAIMKFVEVLFEMDIIEKDLYLKLKYGTDIEQEIVLIKNGISLSLATLLLEKYSRHISIDISNDFVKVSDAVIDEMKENHENEILIYEVQNNIF